MDRNEKIRRLKAMLTQIAPDREMESLARAPAAGFEAMREAVPPGSPKPELEHAHRGLQKLAGDQTPTDDEILGLEAIVMSRERPVVFIRNGSFESIPEPWTPEPAHDQPARVRWKRLVRKIADIEALTFDLVKFAGLTQHDQSETVHGRQLEERVRGLV